MRKHLVTVDAFTGQQEAGFAAYIPPKRFNEFGEGWFAMSQQSQLLDMIEDGRLRGTALRVLAALTKHMEAGNKIDVVHSDIARRMGMKPNNFSAAVRELVQLGVLAVEKPPNRRKYFVLHEAHAWKGRTTEHRPALQRRLTLRNGLSLASSNTPPTP